MSKDFKPLCEAVESFTVAEFMLETDCPLSRLSIRQLICPGINLREKFTWLFSLSRGLDKKKKQNGGVHSSFKELVENSARTEEYFSWIFVNQKVWMNWQQWTSLYMLRQWIDEWWDKGLTSWCEVMIWNGEKCLEAFWRNRQ